MNVPFRIAGEGGYAPRLSLPLLARPRLLLPLVPHTAALNVEAVTAAATAAWGVFA